MQFVIPRRAQHAQRHCENADQEPNRRAVLLQQLDRDIAEAERQFDVQSLWRDLRTHEAARLERLMSSH